MGTCNFGVFVQPFSRLSPTTPGRHSCLSVRNSYSQPMGRAAVQPGTPPPRLPCGALGLRDWFSAVGSEPVTSASGSSGLRGPRGGHTHRMGRAWMPESLCAGELPINLKRLTLIEKEVFCAKSLVISRVFNTVTSTGLSKTRPMANEEPKVPERFVFTCICPGHTWPGRSLSHLHKMSAPRGPTWNLYHG